MVPTNSVAYEVISKGIGTTTLANLYTYTHIHTHTDAFTQAQMELFNCDAKTFQPGITFFGDVGWREQICVCLCVLPELTATSIAFLGLFHRFDSAQQLFTCVSV